MKKIKLFFLFTALVTFGCERDDICAEGTSTTPRLLVEFYDFSDQDELKVVPRLTIYGEGLFEEEPTQSSDTTIVFNANSSDAALPLLVGADGQETTVRFILEKETNFRLDPDNPSESNIDIIEISYTPEFQYVSRACGYKSIFNNLQTSIISDGNNWIIGTSIQVEPATVENENTVHVRIFH